MSIQIKNVLVEGKERNIYIEGKEIAAISEGKSSKAAEFVIEGKGKAAILGLFN